MAFPTTVFQKLTVLQWFPQRQWSKIWKLFSIVAVSRQNERKKVFVISTQVYMYMCCKVFLSNSFLKIVTRNDIFELQQERMSNTRNNSELFNQVSLIQSNNASFLQIRVACLCPNASPLMSLRVYCLIVQEILLICFRTWVFGFKTSHDH